jgi:hypothetical protein
MRASSSTARSAGDDGHLGEIQQLGGAPATFSGNEFKKAFAFPDDERLHNALFADGIGQFLQGLGGKLFSGLEGGRTDAVQRDALDAVTVIGRGGTKSRSGGRLGERRIAAQQRAQATS